MSKKLIIILATLVITALLVTAAFATSALRTQPVQLAEPVATEKAGGCSDCGDCGGAKKTATDA